MTVSATQYNEGSICYCFLSRIQSNYIRQQLYELKVPEFDTTFKSARALEKAHKIVDLYAEFSHAAAAQAAK